MRCDRHICSGVYANNVKCIYTSALGHNVDCNDFTWGIYTEIIVLYLCGGKTVWLLLRSSRIELFRVSKAILGRWSWKGCFSVTLGKTLHVHCWTYQVDTSFSRKMVLGNFLGERASNWYNSFTQKYGFERLFIGDTGEDSAHYLFRSPKRQRSSRWHESFTQKLVLKTPFVIDTGESRGRQSFELIW